MALVTQNILFKVDKLHCGKSRDLKIKNLHSRSAPKLTSYNREKFVHRKSPEKDLNLFDKGVGAEEFTEAT